MTYISYPHFITKETKATRDWLAQGHPARDSAETGGVQNKWQFWRRWFHFRLKKIFVIIKTENGVGCCVDNTIFRQAWGMENIWVDVAENIQTLYKGLDSKTLRTLRELKSQMILWIHSFSNKKGHKFYESFK